MIKMRPSNIKAIETELAKGKSYVSMKDFVAACGVSESTVRKYDRMYKGLDGRIASKRKPDHSDVIERAMNNGARTLREIAKAVGATRQVVTTAVYKSEKLTEMLKQAERELKAEREAYNLERFNRANELIQEGVGMNEAVKLAGISKSHYHEMRRRLECKAKSKPKTFSYSKLLTMPLVGSNISTSV